MKVLLCLSLFLLVQPLSLQACKNNKKQKQLQEILSAIYQATGNFQFSKQPPKIAIGLNANRVAFYIPCDTMIVVEEAAYDLCRSLGRKKFKNALAILIGHQLMHFYQQIEHPSNYLAHKRHLYSIGYLEEQADCFAALAAYFAGYDPKGQTQELIEAIFAHQPYANFCKSQTAYLNKAERIKLAARVEIKVNELIDTFEMMDLCAALGYHQTAIDGYYFLLNHFTGKMLSNKMAVNYMNIILRDIDNLPNSLFYFIEETGEWQLRKKTPNIEHTFLPFQKESILQTSKKILLQALKLDPSFITAKINLMNVELMSNEPNEVRRLYEQFDWHKQRSAEKIPHKTWLNIQLIYALALADKADPKDKEQSNKILQTISLDKNFPIHQVACYHLKASAIPEKSDFVFPPDTDQSVLVNHFKSDFFKEQQPLKRKVISTIPYLEFKHISSAHFHIYELYNGKNTIRINQIHLTRKRSRKLLKTNKQLKKVLINKGAFYYTEKENIGIQYNDNNRPISLFQLIASIESD